MNDKLKISFEVPEGDMEIQTLSILNQAMMRFLHHPGPHEDTRDAIAAFRMTRWLADRYMDRQP